MPATPGTAAVDSDASQRWHLLPTILRRLLTVLRRLPSAPAILGALVVSAGTQAQAQPPKAPSAGSETAPLAACPEMDDDQERLACYDRFFRGSTSPAPAVVQPAPDQAAPAAVTAPAALTAPPPLSNPPPSTAAPDLAAPVTPGAGRELDALLPAGAGPLEKAAVDVRRSLGSTLAERWELDPSSQRGRFLLRPYKPMYAMLADWSENRNQLPRSPNPANNANERLSSRQGEAKFQISLKTKVWEDMAGDNGDLWLGYTQVSYWQIYNDAESRPFRETNYEPEIMAVFRTGYSLMGWDGRLAGLALNHQSNGRSIPLSRSWNRLIAQFGFERKNWMAVVRPWWRIPESARTDDNPDIEDFMGRADLLVVRKSEGHELSLMARHSLRSGSRSHGAFQIDYAFPITSYLKAYAQIFSGYGASLIDYNHRQTRVGIGISLIQWL